MARMWILAAVIACRLQLVESKGFLAQHGSFIIEEVEHTLMMEMPLSGDNAQLLSYRSDLRPMYETLPKNEFGRLSYPTVRYALHRYFVHKHGWYVKGLDPEGKAWNASMAQGSSTASSYLVELFEKRFHKQGLDLDGLAAFAATLSDLIFGEGVKALEEIYDNFGFPLHGVTPPGGFDLVMRGYMAVVTIGDTAELTSRADVSELEAEASSIDPSYPDTVMWLQDMRRSYDWRVRSQSNPFIKSGISWDRATQFMHRFLHEIGGIMRKECNSLKDAMVDMEQGDSGRVALSTFYRNSNLQVHESVAYLRNQGSLEERTGQQPILVIPNYINSPSRCLPFSGYFSVCCPNNCESLQDSVERAVSSPSATPSKLTEVVSHLSSDTVAAPRNLSVLLIARLDQIAAVHQGRVPLHGRLFAQWLHHAFPRECPFPHVSGTINAASQEEWLDMNEDVDSIRATDEEKDLHSAVVNMEANIVSLPWTEEEELVSTHFTKQNSRGFRSYLRPLMAVMLIASFAYPLSRSCMKVGPDAEKAAKPLVSQQGVLV